MNTLNRDVLFNIKSFLNNKDIIELILSSKNISRSIGDRNVFTSITIYKDSNVCDMIRFYLRNKSSIIRTIFIDVSNLVDIWPFSSEVIVFVNCNIKDDYADKNYKNCKNKIIKYRYMLESY